MRSAIIESGIVANIVIGVLPGSIECPEDVALGWSYADGEFSPPPPETPPVPEWVWMFQLRKAMRRTLIVEDHPQYGYTLDALEAYVGSAEDPDLEDEFSASSVRRDHSTVEWMRVLFNWSEEQVDNLFRLAATL
jgi:hypothetical protein